MQIIFDDGKLLENSLPKISRLAYYLIFDIMFVDSPGISDGNGG